MSASTPQSGSSNSDEAAAPAIAHRPLNAEEQRIVRGCLFALGVLSVGTWIGVASAPYLAVNYPLALVAISPLSRHVVLVAPIVDPVWLLLVGGARSLTFSAVSYLLGTAMGEPGLVWLDQRAVRTARFVRWLERFFLRWSYFAVIIFPLGVMAGVAGVSRMRPVGFFTCATVGIALRLSLYIWLASSIREPIMALLEFIRAHQLPATAVCVVGVASYQLIKWKRRRPVQAD
jgi:membrane protein DedA with SNARE-associated domain